MTYAYAGGTVLDALVPRDDRQQGWLLRMVKAPLYACIHIYAYACMYVCMYVCVCVHICKTYAYVYGCAYIYAYVSLHLSVCCCL